MVPGNGLHFRVGCVPNLFIPDGHTISRVSFVYLQFSFLQLRLCASLFFFFPSAQCSACFLLSFCTVLISCKSSCTVHNPTIRRILEHRLMQSDRSVYRVWENILLSALYVNHDILRI